MSTLTEARYVAVHDAWTDGSDAFCVGYQFPYHNGVLGLRRAKRAVLIEDGSMESLINGPEMGDLTDPVTDGFGRRVADFDIGEPIGMYTDHLRVGSDGIEGRPSRILARSSSSRPSR